MSIAMESFAAEGQFKSYDPFMSRTSAPAVFQLQCRCCGHEASESVRLPGVCPKCHSDSWERFARPGSILSNAARE